MASDPPPETGMKRGVEVSNKLDPDGTLVKGTRGAPRAPKTAPPSPPARAAADRSRSMPTPAVPPPPRVTVENPPSPRRARPRPNPLPPPRPARARVHPDLPHPRRPARAHPPPPASSPPPPRPRPRASSLPPSPHRIIILSVVYTHRAGLYADLCACVASQRLRAFRSDVQRSGHLTRYRFWVQCAVTGAKLEHARLTPVSLAVRDAVVRPGLWPRVHGADGRHLLPQNTAVSENEQLFKRDASRLAGGVGAAVATHGSTSPSGHPPVTRVAFDAAGPDHESSSSDTTSGASASLLTDAALYLLAHGADVEELAAHRARGTTWPAPASPRAPRGPPERLHRNTRRIIAEERSANASRGVRTQREGGGGADPGGGGGGSDRRSGGGTCGATARPATKNALRSSRHATMDAADQLAGRRTTTGRSPGSRAVVAR